MYPVSLLQLLYALHRSREVEFHLVLQLVIEVLQHHIVDIRPQMSDGCIQQSELVLHAYLLQARPRSGEHGGVLSSV